MPDHETAIGEAADAAEAASNSTALDVVARSGFAVMALLHIIIGAIAVALVLGAPGQAEPTGAIEQLAANPWGPAVMCAGFIGCAGLSLRQFSEATLPRCLSSRTTAARSASLIRGSQILPLLAGKLSRSSSLRTATWAQSSAARPRLPFSLVYRSERRSGTRCPAS
jgi:hypothetical protein